MRAICRKCVNECTVEMKVAAELPENCLYKDGSVVPQWEPLSDMEKGKAPELMTLEEAIQNREKECIIKNTRTNFEIKVHNDGDFTFQHSFKAGEYFTMEWQIIPAGQKVLTSTEYADNVEVLKCTGSHQYTYFQIGCAFTEGDKNGQLKMYNKLDNEIKKFLHWWNGESSRSGNRLKDIVENLKPLN